MERLVLDEFSDLHRRLADLFEQIGVKTSLRAYGLDTDAVVEKTPALCFAGAAEQQSQGVGSGGHPPFSSRGFLNTKRGPKRGDTHKTGKRGDTHEAVPTKRGDTHEAVPKNECGRRATVWARGSFTTSQLNA